MARLVFVCSLLAVSLAQNDCPVGGCFGCRPPGITTERVTCSAAGLTSIPLLPVDIQQTVEELSLRSNLISSIGRSELENYTSLVTLDFSFNNISYIEPGSFLNTTSLEELILRDNQLQDFPDEQFITIQLRVLDLSQNNIENISAALFRGMQEFSDIRLNDNLIQTIPEETFSELGLIEELSLANNPLRCDCDLRWVPGYLNGSSPLISDFGSCDTPLGLNGTNLETLETGDFICHCSPTCVNGACDLSVGECACDVGYIRADCRAPCPSGMFGSGCLQSCSCVAGNPCDNVDGTCHCLPGRTGTMCELECPFGMYGRGCMLNCSCVAGNPCDNVDGTCHCLPGRTGTMCELECPFGMYGRGCMLNCSCVTENEVVPCNNVDGTCRCLPGYTGTMCELECPDGTYGRGCMQTCMCVQANQASPCNRINGTCNCLPEYTGSFCESELTAVSSLSSAAIGGIIGGIAGFLILAVAVVVLIIAVRIYISKRNKRRVGVERVPLSHSPSTERNTGQTVDPPPPYDFQNSSKEIQESELPQKEQLPI